MGGQKSMCQKGKFESIDLRDTLCDYDMQVIGTFYDAVMMFCDPTINGKVNGPQDIALIKTRLQWLDMNNDLKVTLDEAKAYAGMRIINYHPIDENDLPLDSYLWFDKLLKSDLEALDIKN